MKSTKAKKYAQLVEAQSPEPQEFSQQQQTPTDSSQTSNHSNGTSNSNQSSKIIDMSSASLSTTTQKHQLDQDTSKGNGKRKESQCSQVSSAVCCPSTSSEISDSQMLHSEQSACDVAANSTSSGRGTATELGLRTSISRSMLELDQCASKQVPDQFRVSWQNLTFSYEQNYLAASCVRRRPPNHKTTVLNDVSGSFRSNQLIAIIGPSGCGKTTLLQFLAGNNRSQADKLLIEGLAEPKVAFIGQDDCLLPGLTARETLLYASRLQNTSSAEPNFDHHQHIQPILSELGLLECADRSVTKLSGGQMKRVTIAQELLYPTNILILDEVTSGLDASTSYSIVKLLKQLVSDHQYPMSIVMSIHQPSARLFAVFDQVYVMSEGSCLYEGSCRFDLVNAHLARFNLECPKFHNIADYLIEIASDDLGSSQLIKEQLMQYQRKRHSHGNGAGSSRQANTILASDKEPAGWDEEDELKSQGISMLVMAGNADANANGRNNNANTNPADINDHDNATAVEGISLFRAIEKARGRRSRPIGSHFWIHLSRSLLRIRRSYILTYLQFVTYILLGLQLATFYGADIGTLSGCPRLPMSFMAFVFSKEDETDSMSVEMRRIQENMNFLLVAIMTATFAALEITVITFPMEAKTVKREWRNGWYRVSSYFMGRSLADLPFQVLFVLAFCTVIYTLTGQVGLASWRFVSFITIIMMTALIAQTIGFIFGALFMDNLPAAVFTAPLCIFPALLFSGFFSRVSQIPTFYMPMTYLSHFRYAFDALLVTLYGYDRCNCDQEALVAYHASLENQTSTMRTMFKSLFGASDCQPSGSSEENSIEDVAATLAPPQVTSLAALLNATGSTTIGPKIHTLEDALLDGVFKHMQNGSDVGTTPSDAEGDGGAMDHLAFKFSSRVTGMLNSRSNFGHEVPKQCAHFRSYMMAATAR